MEIGKRCRQAREKTGYTLRGFAHEVNIPINTLSRFERDLNKTLNVEILAAYLNHTTLKPTSIIKELQNESRRIFGNVIS